MQVKFRIGAALCGLLSFTFSANAQRCTPLQLLAPDGAAGDEFGQAVAIDADTMIVGAQSDDIGPAVNQGSASIYHWNGSGWEFEATLTGLDGSSNDNFGFSVAIDGDTAVVGAFVADVGAVADAGAAYVFVRSGTNWTQQARLTASDGAPSDRFGVSLAIRGDELFVGSYGDDIGSNNDQGSVYAFRRDDSGWSQQAKILASDGGAGDEFGRTQSFDGETLLIGAYRDDIDGNEDQGSAYVFVRSGGGWLEQSRLLASNGGEFNRFGHGVGVWEDTVMVGGYLYPGDVGTAYVFTRVDGEWIETQQLSSPSECPSYAAQEIRIQGDTALVADLEGCFGDGTFQGLVSVFKRTSGVWTLVARLSAPDAADYDWFGSGLGFDGDTAVIGARGDDVGANTDQGSAWVFSRVGDRWIGPGLKVVASDGVSGAAFGYRVAIDGDTAVLGAYYDLTVGPGAGSAYVFVRQGLDWMQQAKLVPSDGEEMDHFGYSVALDGDTVVVGAIFDDVGPTADQGSAYVFTRSGSTWSQQAKLTASDGASSDWFGDSVALDGDTAIVGVRSDDIGGNFNQGSAYVFTRYGTVWAETAKLTASDGANGDEFGRAVAIEGDRAIVGAWTKLGTNGAAYVYRQLGGVWNEEAKLVSGDPLIGNYFFGISVDLSEDTAVVGAFGDDSIIQDRGSAHVFVWNGASWSHQAKLIASDGGAFDLFGYSVAIERNTAIIGARDHDASDLGTAYVFLRSGGLWTEGERLETSVGAGGQEWACSASIAGRDVLLGAQFDNDRQGAAYFFDVPFSCFPLAHNLTLDLGYDSLSDCFLEAQSGNQISATSAAFGDIDYLDTFGRSLGLFGIGAVRTPSTSIFTLGGSSALIAPDDEPIDVYGQLLTASNASTYLLADGFRLGSRGALTARTGSSLIIDAPVVRLDGRTRLEQGSAVMFGGSVDGIGPLTAFSDFSITSDGPITNRDTWSLSEGQVAAPLLDNRSVVNIFGPSALFGDFANDYGATTTIRSGTFYVFGSLTNNGTIIGDLCAGCRSGAPSLDVGGDLVLGPAASLTMPSAGSMVRVGGDFDCAIDSHQHYDMHLATLHLEGSGAVQTLEAMSTDIGPDSEGLEPAAPGRYPIGVLRIGSSIVRLVDAHDNDGLGQGLPEAIYVDALVIDAGGRLNNESVVVYYNTLESNGVIDYPENMVQIVPPCRADMTGDGVLNFFDVLRFLNLFSAHDPQADFAQDGVFDFFDVLVFLQEFSAGCP